MRRVHRTSALKAALFPAWISLGLVGASILTGCSPVEPEALVAVVELPDSTHVLDTPEPAPVQEAKLLLHNAHPMGAKQFKTEMLWLARCIYSETKRTDEQFLVAWVIRNRVETRYRNKRSYKRVILDPYQFSAFNPGEYTRRYYGALNVSDSAPGWQNALWIARRVMLADAKDRPFPETTRHFYSERSMKGSRKAPIWSANKVPVSIKGFEIDDRRFRFFDKVY